MRSEDRALCVGWAQTDLTPEEPVFIAGQFHVRLSEGVRDPLTATVLVLESGSTHTVIVSCDLVGIPDELRDAVRARVRERVTDINVEHLALCATHTHTAPDVRRRDTTAGHTSCGTGVELSAMPVPAYLDFAAERIAEAVNEAWSSRAPGKIAYGLGHAVVGRNRRWVNDAGEATMYGDTNTPDFSHIEGYEDHSVNVLATYDATNSLTGVVVNVPCPSQTSELSFRLSADYWHETRQELRRRLGAKLFILPQCSAAGDQSPHPLYEKRAEARMLELLGQNRRQAIAERISDAVTKTLEIICETAQNSVLLKHHVEDVELPLAVLTEDDVTTSMKQADIWAARYDKEIKKLANSPELRKNPRWYVPITRAYRRMMWYKGVAERYKRQEKNSTRRVELHVIRLGDVALATNPFEYYLDFGIHIKCRSKATQTFLIQLAGGGTYVPSRRSVQGGGYGSIAASNPIGPEGGRMIAERTVAALNELWKGA